MTTAKESETEDGKLRWGEKELMGELVLCDCCTGGGVGGLSPETGNTGFAVEPGSSCLGKP